MQISYCVLQDYTDTALHNTLWDLFMTSPYTPTPTPTADFLRRTGTRLKRGAWGKISFGIMSHRGFTSFLKSHRGSGHILNNNHHEPLILFSPSHIISALAGSFFFFPNSGCHMDGLHQTNG